MRKPPLIFETSLPLRQHTRLLNKSVGTDAKFLLIYFNENQYYIGIPLCELKEILRTCFKEDVLRALQFVIMRIQIYETFGTLSVKVS